MSKNKLKTILAGLMMLLPLFSNAQNVYFKNYDISDGLPSNTIMCSIQDRRGFVWLGTKDGICRFDGTNFKLFGDEDETQGVMNGMTQSLCEDQAGNIWFSTSNGLGYYDPETGNVTRLGGNEAAMRTLLCDSDGNIWCISGKDFVRYDRNFEKSDLETGFVMHSACIDSKGELWAVATDGSLRHFNRQQQEFTTEIIPGHSATIITDTGNRHFIIATTENRIISFDYASKQVEVLIDSELKGNTINCILARAEDEYWIACIQGLYIYRYGEGIVDLIKNEGQHSLQDTNVISMSIDSNGNIWLGTFHTGISLWHNRTDSISKFIEDKNHEGLAGRIVHAIGEDRDGNIWVGTEDGGMTIFHISTKTAHNLGSEAGFPESLNFHSMINRGDNMWISTFNGGIYVVDSRKEKVIKHYDVGSNYCGYIYSTPDGTIYVGARTGLFKYDQISDSFKEVPGLSGCWVHCIFEDSNGKLWIATYGQGIYTIEGKMMQHYTTETPNTFLASNYVTSFCEGRDGTLWITTEGGGLCYTSLDDKGVVFKHFARKEGLTSNVACAVMEDSEGTLWVSTTKGLVELNPKSMSVVNVYIDNNGTIDNNFSYASCYVTQKEIVHMGTIKGLLVFEPSLLKKDDKNVPLYIVDIHSGESDSVRQLHSKGKSEMMSEKITVPSKDASYLSISFAAPDYSDIHRHTYIYSFKSGSHVISNETTDNTIVLSNIHPGYYKFSVKIAGSTSPQSEKILSFHIKPPFYLSIIAKLLYALIFASLLVFTSKSIKRKRLQEEQHEHEIMETAKQKELAEAKVNFFTNITHEIRTPLTLIKLPIEKIISEKQYTDDSKEDILTIQSNTDRLLNLTNQLLDIRNIEQRNFKLKISRFDICETLRRTAGLFTPGIKERHMDSGIEIPDRTIFVDSDLDFIEKIICNLMSNAVKYGESKVSIKLEEDKTQGCIRIMVDSDGDKIPDSEAEKIFQQFYQIKMVNSQLIGSNGTGLGLPYARQLAQALNGRLYLDSQRMDCNSFIFEFPVITADSNAEEDTDIPAKIQEENIIIDSESNRHWLLVVEDSEEMNRYLCKELEKIYNILSATNGEEALDIIHNNRVDLVVSDIMMPVMDGCELCNNIKKDVEFSHIPVILLTAAVGVETRIQTLEVGADGYIEKPFSIELLKANIDNLFKNREIAYNQFANSPLSHFKSLVVNNIDQDFMDKLHSVVMDNIADQELSIDTLTQLMCTSKSTLYRKVKANTGANINEYIRICKLKKAAEMLTSQKYRINEVAYLTGFSSPSYFTTCFQKQFKISPSNFVKNLTK